MKKEHCEFFEKEIKKRNIKPTKFLPLWDLLGVGLGFGSTILGKKAAMLCTASVEEVIDKHYQNQINQLDKNERELKKISSNLERMSFTIKILPMKRVQQKKVVIQYLIKSSKQDQELR